ncbi:hypothetical protein TEA_002927 [Camellia sinensis var. sinensis]|uniref:DEK-C domain-containing protein n=1 Tax=Camellia sinensis var. sinensis TaxID=542762 RepID=A0A4S4CXG3_CAMSN|nr:hypothetical protein TEA_002927 [Camellia sinensis var. sinensis]
MVSDSELVNRLWDVLQTSDLNTTTARSVRRTLESEFDIDLSDRKPFFRDQIDSFLDTCVQRTHNNAVIVEEEDEEAIHEEASETLKLKDNKSVSEEEEESNGQRRKKRRLVLTLADDPIASLIDTAFMGRLGMMGSEKTTMGKVLSEALAYSFVDRLNPTCIQNVALEYIRRKSHVSDTAEGVEEGKSGKDLIP